MRLRRWLAIALLSMCSLGLLDCLGIAGGFDIGDAGDASTDQSTSLDGSQKPDGTFSPEAATDADAGPSPATDSQAVGAELEPDAEPDAPTEVEAAPPDSGSVCSETGPCNPGSTPLGPCMSAEYVCTDGGSSVCVAAPVTNGAPCGDAGAAGEAGAVAETEVCFNGVCGACSTGTACPATTACQKNLIDCSTGQAVCADAGLQPDGLPCGADGGVPLYCNAGREWFHS
jgi:hypothetical protein